MSDFTEGSRKRDRHRRHRGSGAAKSGNAMNGNAKVPSGGSGENRPVKGANVRSDPSRDGPSRDGRNQGDGRRDRDSSRHSSEGRRERREELPPLPKLPTPPCPRCGQPIQDITSALADRDSGEPIHFDCVLAFLQGAENLGPTEKLVYIGHGRFAVMVFENPADTKKFKIVRTIEWENRDTKAEWRDDISGRFSQTK